jgi:hypothetical protein
MQKKITSKSFGYVEREDAELYGIKIKEGRYKNVIFTYGKVSLNEDKETGQLGINFNFIVNAPNNRYSRQELNESTKFKNYISEILKFILEEEFTDDEHSKTDIKEDMQ